MRFLVTGTPRAATGYASLLFRELAIPCTHERIFKPRGCLDDVLTWYKGADGGSGESSWLAWAFLGMLPEAVPVLHTTRNPWSVVDSLAHRNDLIPKETKRDRGKQKMVDAIEAYCPEAFAFDGAIDRAAAFVLGWNRKIEKAVIQHGCPYHRYRVEDLDAKGIGEILDFIGVYRDDSEIEEALREVPSNVNGGKQVDYDVTIVNPQIVEAIKRVRPDIPPVAGCVISRGQRTGAKELGEHMDSHLREALNALAVEQGYKTSATADVLEQKGVLSNVD